MAKREGEDTALKSFVLCDSTEVSLFNSCTHQIPRSQEPLKIVTKHLLLEALMDSKTKREVCGENAPVSCRETSLATEGPSLELRMVHLYRKEIAPASIDI